MAQFERWLAETRGLRFADYEAMWRWSVEDLEGFWSAIWTWFDLPAKTPPRRFLNTDQMPGAIWGAGAELNYVEHILRHAKARPDHTALTITSETFGASELSWGALAEQVARCAAALRKRGIKQGDRVVAVLPNTEVALIAFLATASLGAIWSLCAPDMGHVAILDRFRQIKPKALIAQDGYVYAGASIDRQDIVAEIAAGLPSLELRVMVPALGVLPEGWEAWGSLVAEEAHTEPVAVPFDHPLWIVYSSGTTGAPKPIVHGHGGVVLEAAKQSLHHDLGPQDRFAWFTSSGWIMWNAQWMALGQGATVALFDGAPHAPDLGVLWRFVADQGLTYFGAGAAFFANCLKAGITPGQDVDLTALRSIGSTGSPLSGDAFDWIYRAVKADVWLAPISGGTDICGAFVLGHPGLPVRQGEMQCRALGNATYAWDAQGQAVVGAVGELVCTRPLPSMPLYFWGDDGARFKAAYFDTYPNVWRHGDWITIYPDGGSVIYGRSDATINRKGLRLGSAEIYQAVESLDEVQDSLVVDLEYLGRPSFMPLFVVLTEGVALTAALKEKINDVIATAVSKRFLPNEILQIAEVPRTLSGKKLEVPVKKLLLGADPEGVVNRDSMSNPLSFEWFVDYSHQRSVAS